MARVRTAARLHLLTTKQVQAAGEGDHTDGGGLLLRIRGASCSWVLRFTAPSGRRREMGLGVARRGSAAQAGESLTSGVRLCHRCRALRGGATVTWFTATDGAYRATLRHARVTKRFHRPASAHRA